MDLKKRIIIHGYSPENYEAKLIIALMEIHIC